MLSAGQIQSLDQSDSTVYLNTQRDERRRVIHLIVSSDLDHRMDLRPGHRLCTVQRSQVVDMSNTLQWRLSLWN